MAKSVAFLALALVGAAVACGPSGSVTPRVLTDGGGGRPGSDGRLADATAALDGTAETAGPAYPPAPDAAPDTAADSAPAPDAPVTLPPDAPADRPLPPDLPPDLPVRADLSPDLPPDVLDRPGPWMMVTHAPAQALTNLTPIGTLDWVHFGQGGATRVNRKMGAPTRITMTTVGGSDIFPYDDRPVRFSWTDGAPTAQVTGTPDGISNGDQAGRGFELRVEGSVSGIRTLRAYWGVWGGRARVVARFSDNSVPVYMDTTLTAGDPGQDRITTITFRTSQPTQTLLLRWTIDAIDLEFANVTLQAATLSE